MRGLISDRLALDVKPLILSPFWTSIKFNPPISHIGINQHKSMWTLEITSAQFTHPNCNLRTLPHLLLKCVIMTPISRQAVQTHLSVSASTIREMTLHSGLSTFLIWTATFPPIQLTVFIYLSWWDMLEFALPKLTSWIDSADFPYVSDNKVF